MLKIFRAWLARQRMFETALAFNKRHTYAGPWSVGGQWMCPTCSTVHGCTSSNVFTGRQFPACCEFPAGPRTNKHHATGI